MCGLFEMRHDFYNDLRDSSRYYYKKKEDLSLISYCIRKSGKPHEHFSLLSEVFCNFLKESKLPSPQEQADNLVLWLGDNLKYPGKTKDINPIPFQAIIGAISDSGVEFIVQSLNNDGLIIGNSLKSQSVCGKWKNVQLTFKGWQHYDELKRQTTDSYKAFMAMQFSDEMMEVFRIFKEAIKKTGFNLIHVDEKPKPGLIDDKIIVDLRTARFILSDISIHEDENHMKAPNNGAYWEAGFAEGLGKPVIYTCRKKDFEDAHFDTNHRYTISWESDKLEEAAEKLVNMIRAYIPGAKMED